MFVLIGIRFAIFQRVTIFFLNLVLFEFVCSTSSVLGIRSLKLILARPRVHVCVICICIHEFVYAYRNLFFETRIC